MKYLRKNSLRAAIQLDCDPIIRKSDILDSNNDYFFQVVKCHFWSLFILFSCERFQQNTCLHDKFHCLMLPVLTFPDCRHKTRLHIGQLVKDTSEKLKQVSERDHHTEVNVSFSVTLVPPSSIRLSHTQTHPKVETHAFQSPKFFISTSNFIQIPHF